MRCGVFRGRPFLCAALLVVGLALAARAADTVYISEFLASNNGGLTDENGESSDWIEIFNSGTNSVNLNGWYLTDSASNLTKWRFPSTNIAPNGFVIVFASGKNRAVPGAPLHANFSLSADGEYLALVRPDGVTVASGFEPAFPEQFSNISYGNGQNVQVTALISNRSPASVLAPTNGNLAMTWTTLGFEDPGWIAGTNGVGYETYVAGFAVKNIRATGGVCDLATADAVLASPSLQAAVFSETRNFVNYFSTGGSGNFGGDITFPGFTIGVDIDNFVLEATGIITIPTGGAWTFGVNSDDGFRVEIGTYTFSYPTPRGPGNTFATFTLGAGEYPVRLVFFECNGGAGVEFFAAAGSYTGFGPAFRLVGDSAAGGLAVKSLPSTAGSSSLRQLIATDVQSEMLNRASSAFVRLPFNVPDPTLFSTLTLRMKYDDGYVAYLNGTEVARRNAPAFPQWNSVATLNRPGANALAFEDLDLTSRLNLLQTNGNVLALHALNDSASSSDFLVLMELVENKVLGTAQHYFSTPSPCALNGSGFFAFVDNLKFTPGRGWFDSTNFSITITSATTGVTIRYTTNGTAPNATNGYLYTGGIPVSGTTLVRATGYRDGFEPTEVETHSYIFLNAVQAQSTNLNWAGGSSGNYTLLTNITESAQYGPTFKGDLLSVPTLSIVMDPQDIFGPSGVWSNPQAEGVAWERACSLEYMRPDDDEGFEINCGIRIQGGASRNLVPKHGFRVLFKNIYGPGKLKYPLFESPVQEFDTLTLHATFNDHWLWGGASAQMIRDQWCRDTQNAMGGFGPHGTYVHLYVNGLYWGLYNIGEKGDASFAAHYLAGEKEEYDAYNSDELIDGSSTAWSTMLSIANAGITNDAAYTNLSQYLNIPNFIDYLLMNFYAANADWPSHNWNAARRRVAGAGFHFFSWDAEWTFGIGANINTDRTGETAGSPGALYSKLRAHPEFRVQFGDRAQKHLFNGGVLTPAIADGRWMKRAGEIDRAVVPELARWGNGYTRATWLSAQSAVRSWFPQRGAIVINHLRNAGLLPQLSAPGFGPFGGMVTPGYALHLTNLNATGSIYYTTDGSDPRQWGGGLSFSARLYSAPLEMTNAMFLRARVRDGANWSAIVEAPFYVVQDYSALAVTEIMYNPLQSGVYGSDELEFLELKNTGGSALDLSGLQFTEGIAFRFTNGTRLPAGGFFLLARNPAAFAQRYPGVAANGLYTGKLDNSGERLTLAHVLGTNVFSFQYNNAAPWPITPDGHGFSLVRASLMGNPDSSLAWRPSANVGGSPGADDPPFDVPVIVISEILTHTDPPQEDAIELRNATAADADVGGWFLSDDVRAPAKFRIPNGTVIPAGGFVLFSESQFNVQSGIPPSFALNSHGESLFLFSGDANTNLTGYSHGFEYGAAANGVSFGRFLISTGEENWPARTSVTLGASNSPPRVGPVVINEVSYHPEEGFDEFVELFNLGDLPVPLYDPEYVTNRWKLGGLGYVFSNTVSIPSGGYLLVTPLAPSDFREKYSVPESVQIVGPYSGALQNSGERLRLERPDPPDLETNGTIVVPYIVVDEVRYNDKQPWPVSADGDGPSLQRRVPELYGNEPTNWFASGPTPGTSNVINLPPEIALTSPSDGAVFASPADITLSATASDLDGVVAEVSFQSGDIQIGAVTNAPFTTVWSNAPVGSHQIIAKARDNKLAVQLSQAVLISVTPPPVGTGIGLRGDYYENSDFSGTRLRRVDSVVNFEWGTGAPDPGMGADTFSVRWTGQGQPRFSETYTFYTVTDDGVRLWVNNELIIDRWVDQGPTEWSGVIQLEAGRLYDIRMDYYENGGGATAQLWWSSPSVGKEVVPSAQLYPPVTSNLPPSVAITSPETGAVYVATSPVTIVASALDPDGAVALVQFFAGETAIGQRTSAPFTISWTNNIAGTFLLKAVVTDDNGLSRTSAPVQAMFRAGFTTNLTLTPTGAVWKYLDNGSDQGGAWSGIAFDDAAWVSGPAQLGYGDGDERTVVSFGPNSAARHITTYFRRFFEITNAASFTSLGVRVLRDDGVIVYLNGSEVFRDNIPSGPAGYLTPAAVNIGGADESTFRPALIDPGYLVNGRNVLAVEIHQNNGASADISFDLELTGVQSFIAPYFTVQPVSVEAMIGDDVLFSASVAGTAPLHYQWRHNGTNIGGAISTGFMRSNVQAGDAGAYTLVVTNVAGAATSEVATLTFTNSDSDGDGMPDTWETLHGLDPDLASDATLDPDGDGMSSLQEYWTGTDPLDVKSVLRVSLSEPGQTRLQFVAQPNISYRLQVSSNLSVWAQLTNIAPQSQATTVSVWGVISATNEARFYRAVTP